MKPSNWLLTQCRDGSGHNYNAWNTQLKLPTPHQATTGNSFYLCRYNSKDLSKTLKSELWLRQGTWHSSTYNSTDMHRSIDRHTQWCGGRKSPHRQRHRNVYSYSLYKCLTSLKARKGSVSQVTCHVKYPFPYPDPTTTARLSLHWKRRKKNRWNQ